MPFRGYNRWGSAFKSPRLESGIVHSPAETDLQQKHIELQRPGSVVISSIASLVSDLSSDRMTPPPQQTPAWEARCSLWIVCSE
eukprot:gene10416-biopygen5225